MSNRVIPRINEAAEQARADREGASNDLQTNIRATAEQLKIFKADVTEPDDGWGAERYAFAMRYPDGGLTADERARGSRCG
jgi:hypothetical protein